MPDKGELYDLLKLADQADQVGYTRHLCELYLKDNPDHAPTLVRYGCNLISLGQYALAKQALDHAQAVVSPEFLHHVLAHQGHLLQAQGHFSAAEEMFMRAHELDPDDATYLIYAGSAAFAKGDIDRAVSLARRAVECSEGCIDEAYFNLGGISFQVANIAGREIVTLRHWRLIRSMQLRKNDSKMWNLFLNI
jgi:tetratricopeptide (TPR) repeat protein